MDSPDWLELKDTPLLTGCTSPKHHWLARLEPCSKYRSRNGRQPKKELQSALSRLRAGCISSAASRHILSTAIDLRKGIRPQGTLLRLSQCPSVSSVVPGFVLSLEPQPHRR